MVVVGWWRWWRWWRRRRQWWRRRWWWWVAVVMVVAAAMLKFVAVAVVAVGGRSRGLAAPKRAVAWAAQAVSLLEYSPMEAFNGIGIIFWMCGGNALYHVGMGRMVVCRFRCRRRCLPTPVAPCRATSSVAISQNFVDIESHGRNGSHSDREAAAGYISQSNRVFSHQEEVGLALYRLLISSSRRSSGLQAC